MNSCFNDISDRDIRIIEYEKKNFKNKKNRFRFKLWIQDILGISAINRRLRNMDQDIITIMEKQMDPTMELEIIPDDPQEKEKND